jgi:phosphoribulokinase
VCGLHALYLPQTRAQLDLKIYLDTQPELQQYWKISRDVADRGYTIEKILRQIEARRPDTEKYIYPQKQYADLILRYYFAHIPMEYDGRHKVSPISVQATFSASVDTEPLILTLSNYGVHVEYDYSDDLTRQTLHFKDIETYDRPVPYYQIAQEIIPKLDEITLIHFDDSNPLYGVVKLLIVFLISHQLEGAF